MREIIHLITPAITIRRVPAVRPDGRARVELGARDRNRRAVGAGRPGPYPDRYASARVIEYEQAPPWPLERVAPRRVVDAGLAVFGMPRWVVRRTFRLAFADQVVVAVVRAVPQCAAGDPARRPPPACPCAVRAQQPAPLVLAGGIGEGAAPCPAHRVREPVARRRDDRAPAHLDARPRRGRAQRSRHRGLPAGERSRRRRATPGGVRRPDAAREGRRRRHRGIPPARP